MKKIVSLVMAVVMCLSVAVVGTASASAKSINYKGFHVEKKIFTRNPSTSYFTTCKVYNVNEVFAAFLMDNTSIKKAKHIRRINNEINKKIKISSKNFYHNPDSKNPTFIFKKTGKAKINFSYKYKKKTFRTSINVHVYDYRIGLKVIECSEFGNIYKLKFKVINEIKPNTFYVKSRKKGTVYYLSKNKSISAVGRTKNYKTPITFVIHDKNKSSNSNRPAIYNYDASPTYIKTNMGMLHGFCNLGKTIYANLHERNYFLPQR